MSGLGSEAKRLGTLVVQTALDDNVSFLAASIAYYAILSIFPMLLLVLVIGSIVGGEVFAERIVELVSDILTPEAEVVLEEALRGEDGRSGASIVGLGFLLWSSLRVFRGLDIAFSQIYAQAPDPGFLRTVRNALFVFGAIGVAMIAILIIRGYLRFLDLPPMVSYLSPILVFVTITIVFYPMYYIFPNERQHPRHLIPGAIFAGFGWAVLTEVFGIYAANAGTYALFGIIGGVLLLLVWFYLGAIVILLGAVINAVLAGEYRPREIVIGKEQ